MLVSILFWGPLLLILEANIHLERLDLVYASNQEVTAQSSTIEMKVSNSKTFKQIFSCKK
jgi:hypothetical protein